MVTTGWTHATLDKNVSTETWLRMVLWLETNCGKMANTERDGKWCMGTRNRQEDPYTILFKHEDDRVMFTLAWL